MAKKLERVAVRWNRKEQRWQVLDGKQVVISVGAESHGKDLVIGLASEYCRAEAEKGRRLELTIYLMNQRVGTGNGARRTYPRRAETKARG